MIVNISGISTASTFACSRLIRTTLICGESKTTVSISCIIVYFNYVLYQVERILEEVIIRERTLVRNKSPGTDLLNYIPSNLHMSSSLFNKQSFFILFLGVLCLI